MFNLAIYLIPLAIILQNSGHRLGCDNTVLCLERSLEDKIYLKSGFKYFEFDIRETLDHKLVVNHDKSYKGQIISETLYNDLCLPTTAEILDILNEEYLGKIAIEVKNLHSDEGRELLWSNSRQDNVVIITTRKRFKRSFPNGCGTFKSIRKVGNHSHNFCEERE